MKRLLLILVLGSLWFGCTKSKTTFNTDESNNDNNLIEDVDKDAVTVNNGNDEVDENGFDDFVNDASTDGVWVPSSGDFVLRDTQTGSLWNVRGEAFEGPLAGQRLEQVPAFNAFWFAWSVFYHGSEVWNQENVNTPGELEGDDNCDVPCGEIILGCGGGQDCIPALDFDGRDNRPTADMVDADSAGAEYLAANDFVLGVVIDGEARAYPHNVLWWHEIYNDKIGDTDFTVSFCPLTGSGMVHPGELNGEEIDYGVSGNLYNSNLVMFDRQTETLWSQMIFQGVSGERRGDSTGLLPVVETTWARWKEMYPETKVASDSQGYPRNYESYPYGNYREDHTDTFRPTNPRMEDFYQAKDRVLGLPGQPSRAYAMPEMAQLGDRVVINDTFADRPIVVLFEAEHRLALPFKAEIDNRGLTFEGAQAP